MLRGLYSAASGMITQQRKHDTITNNIANLNTPGYKQVNSVSRAFPEMLISLINGGERSGNRYIGHLNTGVMVDENVINFIQGDLQETNNRADFALVSNIQQGEAEIQPQAFFTIINAQDQERYTRNGKFVVHESGQLMTTDGHRVLGQSGEPIFLDAPIDSIRMTESGLMLNADTGQPVLDELGGQISLLISQIDQPNELIREGTGVFRLNNAEENPARPIDNLDEINVMQGFIERSNVDPTQSMTDMMMALRAYEANQQVIQSYDRTMEKAANEVGRV